MARAQTKPPAATVLPGGGTVTAGQATIAQSGNTLNIQQSGDRAIIDWSSFSIGEGASVLFQNGNGATLNRVSGAAASRIDGQLRASGSVYLINPNGIVIGAHGLVETGGSFVASTLNVPDAAFHAGGNLTFSGASRASVVNLGKVGSLGGNVSLIGAMVENRGTVSAPGGTAGLIAGTSVLVRDRANDGGGLFSVLYGDRETSTANGGIIAAANIELRAQQGNVYALAGNTAGTVNATGIRAGEGKVWLVSEGGTTKVAGAISARGADGGSGAIETSGYLLHVGNSSIDAHGGTWLLDPEDLMVDAAAASSINAALAGNTGVTLQTGATGASAYGNGNSSGAGDILINAALSWNTGATLTLDSYHGIAVNADISVGGSGSVVLRTNNGGSGGDISFAFGKSIAFADGSGGQSLTINGTGYSLIRSWTDLLAINDVSGNFALAHDLGASSFTEAAIPYLRGTLTGLGNSLSFRINAQNKTHVGLFGQIRSGAVLRDLVLLDSHVADWNPIGSSNIGVAAGTNSGLILNVAASGGSAMNPDGTQTGGLVGENRSGEIRNSWTDNGTLGYMRVGGLVGLNSYGGKIVNSFAMGEAYGAGAIGGLVGENRGFSSIRDSYATGNAIGNWFYVGGEYQEDNKVPAPNIGGLVGISGGSITRSYATGTATGSDNIGGLVGQLDIGGSIDTAYATGAVSGRNNIGGLVGAINDGLVNQAYATGSVTGRDYVGGFVGFNYGTINYAYASGRVTREIGSAHFGGFAGGVQHISAAKTITNSYWDREGTGWSVGIANVYDEGLTGLSAAAMKQASNFAGWDIDAVGGQAQIWRIYQGSTAPLLKAFLQPANVTVSGSTSATMVYDRTRPTGLFAASVLLANGQVADAGKVLGTLGYACSGGDASCSNAGTYAVRLNGLYSGQTGYDLIFSNANASLTITPRDLHITANDRTMTYGDALPSLGFSGSGLVVGDSITGSLATAASSTASVGNYAIGQGTLSAGSNYTLIFTAGNLAITPRALSVTANDHSMIYGDARPALTYTTTGLVNGDTLAGTLVSAASATASVGNYAIGQGSLNAGGNYTLSFTAGNLAITPRTLSVTANGLTMAYGDAPPSLTYTANGLVNGDTLSGTLATLASATTSVGSYGITRGTLAASSNYALSFTAGNLAITPRALSVTANSATMTYGDAPPSLTYGVTGLVNGDALTGALATLAGATASVGSYGIGLGTLSADGNYALSFTGGSVAITPRALSVTANDLTMVYGDALPSLTYTINGLVNGDTLAGALGTLAGPTASVGSYGIGLGTLSAGGNYALSFAGASLSITPRALHVTAKDRTMAYGDALPSLTYTTNGLVNGDTLVGALDTLASATASVGNYGIGPGTLSASGNYALSFTGGSLAIAPRALTVTANDLTMVYGDALPALGYTASGLVNGDTLTGALSTLAGPAASVGSYGIGQGTLGASPNYALSFVGGSVSIIPRAIRVTANDTLMVYGNGLPSLTYGVTGLVNGDALSGALSTTASSAASVGSYGIGQGTLAASANYALSFTGGSVAITPRALNVTANDQTMVYGDALPSLTYGVSGLVNGDTLSGALATLAGATASVGSYGIGQGTLGASANYTLSFTGGSVSITPRALTVTANDGAMVYGDALPSLTYTANGLVNGDSVSGALATLASASASVGSYGIGQGTLDAGGNYALRFAGGTMAITPRALSVTANSATMTYGDALSSLTYTTSGLVNGDALSGALATAASATAPVGSYGIGQGTLAASANYVLSFTGGAMAITPRALSVAANSATMTYGDALPSLTYTATGLVNGDMLAGALATLASSTASVGSYGVTQGSLRASSNYSLSFTGGNLAITPRALSVTANDLGMTYGDALPSLSYLASGLVNGDTLSGALATAASSAASVGSYAIGQGSLAASGNYALRFTQGSVSITPRALSVTANDRDMVYGDALPALTYGVNGLVNGDTLNGALATLASSTASVGSYGIGQGTLSASGNYALSFTGGAMTITPRALSVAANSATMTYGDALPALTYAATGLVNGDTLTGALGSLASPTASVGSYGIGQGTLSAGGNYVLSFTGGTVAITPRALSVTANSAAMTYGDVLPALTYAASGLVNGDTLSGALSTLASSAASVGSYGIGQGTLAASGNYTLRFTGGTLSIGQRALTITARDRDKFMGTALVLGNTAFTTSGLVNGDRVDSVSLNSEGAAADAGVLLSPYAIRAGDAAGIGLGNYAITYRNAPVGLTVRIPILSPTNLSVKLIPDIFASQAAPAAANGFAAGPAGGAGAVQLFPGIFLKRQN